MKSERPSKNDEQHYRCVVREGTTGLQSPGRKSSFLPVLSFLRRRTSTSFGSSRRFLRWQNENQDDSRLGIVRTIISDVTCVLLNAKQIKMVSREAWGCAIPFEDRPGLHVCMRAYLRNLLGSAPRVLTNPLLWNYFFLFNSFGRCLLIYPVESPRSYLEDLVLVDQDASLDKHGLHLHVVADRLMTAKRTDGTLYETLRRDTQLPRSCPTEGNIRSQNSRVAVTPIILTTMHTLTEPQVLPTLTCTSCHVCQGNKCDI